MRSQESRIELVTRPATLQTASPETRLKPTENAVTSTEKLKLVTTHKSRVTTRVTQRVTALIVTAVKVVTAVTTMTEYHLAEFSRRKSSSKILRCQKLAQCQNRVLSPGSGSMWLALQVESVRPTKSSAKLVRFTGQIWSMTPSVLTPPEFDPWRCQVSAEVAVVTAAKPEVWIWPCTT